MKEPRITTYTIGAQRLAIRHPDLGYSIDLDVPTLALHRPAVRANLKGRYYEAFSHLNFKRILDYRGNGAVIHAGTFFGDMLHTHSLSASRVYAFEPVLDNYYLAKKNAERLGLGNLLLFNAALSDANGVVRIVTEQGDGGFAGGASSVGEVPGRRSEAVTALRIDDLPIDNLCLLQLDVEGHERQALTGAVNTIRRCCPVVLVEDNAGDCAGVLEGLGYRLAFTGGGLSYWAMAADHGFVAGLQG